jgi:hypothetical protein
MKVRVEILRAALNQLLDHAKEMEGDTIDVDEDLYWFIPKDVLHDATTEPRGLTLGSLEDDWAEVSAIGTRAKDAFGYGLVWASSVLRAIGNKVP